MVSARKSWRKEDDSTIGLAKAKCRGAWWLWVEHCRPTATGQWL